MHRPALSATLVTLALALVGAACEANPAEAPRPAEEQAVIAPPAQEARPPDRSALLAAGREAMDFGEYGEAADRFRDVARVAPRSSEAIEAVYQLGVLAQITGDHSEAIQRFEQVRTQSPPHERHSVATFRLAESLRETGQPDRALPLYEEFARTNPAVDDYVRVQRARLLTGAGIEAALQELALVEAAPSSPPVKRAAGKMQASLLMEAGNYSRAADLYGRLAADAGLGERLGLQSQQSQALRSVGRFGEQQRVLADIARVYPSSADAWRALEALGVQASQVMTPYQIGRVYYFHRVNDRALAEFTRHRTELPGSAEEPWARYRTALVYQRLNQNDECLQELAALVQAFPASEAAQDGLWERARFLAELKRFDQAQDAYADFRRRYPATQRAQDAVFEEALTHYRAGDFSGAAAALGSLGVPVSGTAGAARNQLWRGKALQAGGSGSEALQAFAAAARLASGSYYGLRAEVLQQGASAQPAAGLRLNNTAITAAEDLEAVVWLGRWVPDAATAVAEAQARMTGDRLTARAALLAEMGQHDAVADEYRAAVRAVKTDGPALLAMARLLHERGQHAPAMLAVDYLQDVTATQNPRELPRLLQKVLRPTPYLPLVQAAATQHRVGTAMLYALMRQESLFDPRAFSSAQARGLTQVIPATGEEIAANLGVDGFQQSDLFRPVVSIRFGAYYLARQLAFLGGQPVFALAAYNGGPGSALRWMANNRQMDPDLFVENIDYDETRLYVHKVMENYAFYRLLYGQ